MADEQAQGEVETPAVETPEQQTSEETSNGSEAEQTPVTENTEETTDDDKGDLRVPLREERQKRQELESRLNDPNFVYERARALGLTQEEAQAEVQQSQTQVPNLNELDARYEYLKAKDKSVDKYPQLAKDEEDQIAVTALSNAKGISLLQAADKYYAKVGKVKEEAKVEGINQAKTEITAKEQAQTVSSGSAPTGGEDEARLRQDAKSYNKHVSEAAQLELIKIRNKKLGI